MELVSYELVVTLLNLVDGYKYFRKHIVPLSEFKVSQVTADWQLM